MGVIGFFVQMKFLYCFYELSKLVVITEYSSKIKNLLSNTVFNKICTTERALTKWKNYKLLTVTFFAVTCKENSMEGKAAVLTDRLVQKNSRLMLKILLKTQKPYNVFSYLFGDVA